MLLTGLLVVILVFLFLGITQAAFEAVGFSQVDFAILLVATLIGSFINIPITRISGIEPVTGYREVSHFGFIYRIPVTAQAKVSTIVAINVGGAVVPIIVSAYLLLTHAALALDILIGVVITSIAVHLMARKVKGEGIQTPALLPPIAAAIISILLHPASGVAIVAYISGSMGALIGADLSNLGSINDLGAPFVSIGGAGTVDGVFLTGIIAVILVSIF